MNRSIKQLFLMAIISSFYTATVLPTKYRDRKHAQEHRILALRKMRNSGVHKPIILTSNTIAEKWFKASYVNYEFTPNLALYDANAPITLPDQTKRIRKSVERFSPSTAH